MRKGTDDERIAEAAEAAQEATRNELAAEIAAVEGRLDYLKRVRIGLGPGAADLVDIGTYCAAQNIKAGALYARIRTGTTDVAIVKRQGRTQVVAWRDFRKNPVDQKN